MAEQIRVAMMPSENGKKMMMELEERMKRELQDYLFHHADTTEAEMISRANVKLYNMAQSRGISLWKLCFEVMPQWVPAESHLAPILQGDDMTRNIEYDLRLVPIMIDWEHGPGYWEKKYRDLKERVKGLLEDKED